MKVNTQHALSTLCLGRWVNWCTALIQRKACKLRLTNASGGPSEVGLVGNDVIRSFENMKWGCLVSFSL